MKPRRLLTLLGLAAILGSTESTADILATRGLVFTGQVVKAVGDGYQIKVGNNEFEVKRVDIVRAEIAKPDAFEKGLAALRAGKPQEALTHYKSIVDRYAGIALPWVEESLVRLGDAQLALKDFVGAKATFDSFKSLYPKSAIAQLLEAKNARILYEQGQTDKAHEMAKAILDALFKREFLTAEQEVGVASCYMLIGDYQEKAGKFDEALDNYLRVIALYDVDPDYTIEAKYKAGKLIEKRGNWRRAKRIYTELLQEAPTAVFADDISKRLAAIAKAHPE